MTRLTSVELNDWLREPGHKLIDVRPIDHYNGWPANGAARGGHIPRAMSLPAKWTRYLDWLDIVQSKGLRPTDALVLYGENVEQAEQVAAQFARAGYDNVRVYEGFASEWCRDPDLPLSRLPRYRHLVSARWLHGLLESGTAPEYDNERFVVCHAHYRNPAAYHEGHVPGAIALDTNSLESPDTWNRRPPAELEATLAGLGIRHDTTAILYGRFSFPRDDDPFPGSSAGHLGAMRCAFLLLYAGVRDVRVLNGGWQSWVDEELPVATENETARSVADFGVPIPQHPELAVDTPEAKRILLDEDRNLVSVRSWKEFIGEVSGYNYIEKKGRIPGAVFGNCGSDAYHMENYRNVDHTTREYHEIEALWARAGVTPRKYNAFYCGTGWRASEAFLNAWWMGWPRISVYDGGWFEWSRDERNPYDVGTPP